MVVHQFAQYADNGDVIATTDSPLPGWYQVDSEFVHADDGSLVPVDITIGSGENKNLPSFGDGGNNGGMNERVARIESRLDSVEVNLSELKQEVKGLRWWVLGSALGSVLTMAAIVIAFGAYQASWFQKTLDRNWEVSRKAEERATESNIKIEAMRLAAEWQKQAAQPSK